MEETITLPKGAILIEDKTSDIVLPKGATLIEDNQEKKNETSNTTTTNSVEPAQPLTEPSATNGEVIEPSPLPKSYQYNRSNTSELEIGKTYQTTSRETKRWNGEYFEKNPDASPLKPLLEYSLKGIKGIVPEMMEKTDTLPMGIGDKKTNIAEAYRKTEDVQNEAAQLAEQNLLLTSFAPVQQLNQLNEQYAQATPEQKIELQKQIDELAEKPITNKDFVGTRFSRGDLNVSQNFTPTVKAGQGLAEYDGEEPSNVVPEKIKTVGDAYAKAKQNEEFIKDAQAESFTLNSITKAEQEKLLEPEQIAFIEAIQDPSEKEIAFTKAVDESKTDAGVATSFLRGMNHTMEGLFNTGKYIGMKPDDLEADMKREYYKSELFGVQPEGLAAKTSEGIGGIVPDIAISATRLGMAGMVASMSARHPQDALKQYYFDKFAKGEDPDYNEGWAFATLSTAINAAVFGGAALTGKAFAPPISKTVSEAAINFLKGTVKNAAKDAAIFGLGGKAIQDLNSNAFDVEHDNDYLQSAIDMGVFGGVMHTITHAPAIIRSKMGQSKINKAIDIASFLPAEYTTDMVRDGQEKGFITPEQGEEILIRQDRIRNIVNQFPKELTLDQIQEIEPLYAEKEKLMRDMKGEGVSETMKKMMREKVKELDEKALIKGAVPLTREEKSEYRELISADATEGGKVDKGRLTYLRKRMEAASKEKEAKQVAQDLTDVEALKFIDDHAVQPQIQKSDYRPNFGLSSAELEMGLRHIAEGKMETVSAKRILNKIAEWKRQGYVDMLAGGGGTKAAMSKKSIPFELVEEIKDMSNEEAKEVFDYSDAIDKKETDLDALIEKDYTNEDGSLNKEKLLADIEASKDKGYWGDLLSLSEEELLHLQSLANETGNKGVENSLTENKNKGGEIETSGTGQPAKDYEVTTEPTTLPDGEPAVKVTITKPNGEKVDAGIMLPEDVQKETDKKIRGLKLSETKPKAEEAVAEEAKPDIVGKEITFEHAGTERTGTVNEIDKDGNYKVKIKGINYTVKPKDAKISTEPASTQKFYENVAGAKPSNQTGRIPVEPIIGGKPKNIRDIIFDVTKAAKQRLFFAKPSSRRGSLGTYSPGNSAVKIKFNGDLDVTAHELGHSIDDHFGILSDLATTPNLPVEIELAKFSPFGSKPPKGHPNPRLYEYSEGFAEYLRARIVNPDAAKAEAPELTRLYESKVSAEYKKAVDDFSTDVRTWAGASGRDITLSNIEVEPKKETLMGKILGSGEGNNEFVISWVDRLAANFTNPLTAFNKAFEYAKDIKGAEVLPADDPRILARLLLGVDGKYGEILQHGMIDGENKLLLDANGDAKNLDWLLKPLDNTDQSTIKRDAEDVMAYMISERTVELSKKFGRETVLSGVGGGVFKDVDVAQKTLDEFNNGDPNRLARIQEAANRYREFSDDILKYMVEKGRMSKENYDQIKKDNLQYVAMMRVMETEPNREIESSFGKGGKLGNKGEPIKKITGSTKTIQNPYISLINTLHKAVTESDRNDVLRSFRDMLVDNRSMYEGEPKRFSDIGVIGKQGDKNAITIFVDGKPEHWIFQEDVYRALKGLDGEAYKIPALITAFPKILRWTVTHFPTFAARNVVRDTQDRIIKSNDGSGFGDLVGDKEHWRELARSGGLNAGYYMRDRESYYGLLEEAMHDMAKNKKFALADPIKLRETWDAYKGLLTKSETINRVAEYRAAFKKAKADGMDDYNASIYAGYKSRDLMDFALMGHYMKVVNQLIPFSNAAIQGTRKVVTSAKENPTGFAARMAIYTVAQNIALWLLNHRDDKTAKEYEALPAYQRDMAWNLKLKDNLWLSVPKPFELSLGGAGIDRTLSYYLAGNKNAFDGYGGSVAKSLMPIDQANVIPIAPAAVEGMMNYDLFRDKSVVPPSENDIALELRNTQYASRAGKLLQDVSVQADKIMPMDVRIDARKIDHFIKGQFSYFGKMGLEISDIGRKDSRNNLSLEDLGFFKQTPAYNSPQVQNFLDYAKKWKLETGDFDRLAKEYFEEKDDAEKDKKADILVDYADKKLKDWKKKNKAEKKVKAAEKKKH